MSTTRRLDVDLADDEIARRVQAYQRPATGAVNGVFGKYAKLVSSASEGAVTARSRGRLVRGEEVAQQPVEALGPLEHRHVPGALEHLAARARDQLLACAWRP